MNEIKLLDHGYVRFIESYGSDERIVEAARMSTDKGFLGWGPRCSVCGRFCGAGTRTDVLGDGEPEDCQCDDPSLKTVAGDEKLLAYLYNNKHSTPFEMAGLIIEVKAPIFVFREWHRHRTQSFNEMSARYVPLPDENYVPSLERLMIGSDGKNKQAGTVKGAGVLTEEMAKIFQHELRDKYQDQQVLYKWALDAGVPKELARIHLPVGRYSKMRAAANLRNWLAFLTLRMDGAAQWEIRQYANAVGSLIETSFPRTWDLFNTK